MKAYHAVVWIDHREARVFFFDRHKANEIDITATAPDTHLHHKAGSLSGHRATEDQAFLHAVVTALKPATEWLIVGPGSAKLDEAHPYARSRAGRSRGRDRDGRSSHRQADRRARPHHLQGGRRYAAVTGSVDAAAVEICTKHQLSPRNIAGTCFHSQCDISTGTVICRRISRLAPPRTNSRKRDRP